MALLTYRRWLESDLNENDGQCTVHADQLLGVLRIQNVITKDESDIVESKTTSNGKNEALFLNIMPSKGEEGLKKLIQTFQWNHNEQAQKLLHFAFKSGFHLGDFRKDLYFDHKSNILNLVQQHLADHLRISCDFVAEFWTGALENPYLQYAFVDVVVRKNFGKQRGTMIQSYPEVFENTDKRIRYRRILIEGDPGCGKSTYVNKLALDWVSGNEYLKSTFELVFIINLNSLITTIEQSCYSFVPPQFYSFVEAELTKANNKVLIIFDGYDECSNMNGADRLNKILGLKLYPYVTVIVTTRSSHIDELPIRSREQWLLIEGFNDTTIKEYMRKQECKFPTLAEYDLLHTPLFCAIWCTLDTSGLTLKIHDSYGLVEAFVDNIVNHFRIGKELTSDYISSQLLRIGQFALSHLTHWSISGLNSLDPKIIGESKTFDLTEIHFGLLIKKKIPTGGYMQFKEEFGFAHQIIAEYLAAHYIATSVDLHIFTPSHFYGYSLSVPFNRFLLNKIFLRWIEGKLNDDMIENFFNEPELGYVWYCKLDGYLTSEMKFSNFERIRKLQFDGATEVGKNPLYFKHLQICRNLKVLILDLCDLTLESIKELVLVLHQNDGFQLEEISLYSSRQVGSCSEIIGAISRCNKLETLSLMECDLSLQCVTEFQHQLNNDKFCHLKNLNLKGNTEIGNQYAFFAALSKCRKMKLLNLDRCNLTSESLQEMEMAINLGAFQRLETLYLSDNEMVGQNENIFIELAKLKNLTCLHLTLCNLMFNPLKMFVSCLHHGFPSLISLTVTVDDLVEEVDHVMMIINQRTEMKDVNVYHKGRNVNFKINTNSNITSTSGKFQSCNDNDNDEFCVKYVIVQNDDGSFELMQQIDNRSQSCGDLSNNVGINEQKRNSV